jgi:signal transduction histidine kinase
MNAYKPQLAQIEVYELIDKLASTTTDLVTIHDVELDRIVYHNDSDIWKGMLNVDVYELRGEERVEAIVHPDYQEIAKQFLRERKNLENGEVKAAEVKLINGHWICIRSKIFQRDQEGQATQIISFIRNITIFKETEQELARRDADDALRISEADLATPAEAVPTAIGRVDPDDKAKVRFFNHLSHEFRTPLTLLMGALEGIVKGDASGIAPEALQKLQLSYRSAGRLQKMVNNLLDLANIEENKLEAIFQPTNFTWVTADLAANFRSVVEKNGLKYVVRTEVIAAPIYLNGEMWEKVVFNLLSNAFKFTHEGKIEVIVREKKKHVELKVRDTGVGIATKNLDRIFETFAHVEGTRARARANEGTGIGLALVRELVAAHGGTLTVKSEEGLGSEFLVSIPKGKSHLPARQVQEHTEQLPSPAFNNCFVDEAMRWISEAPTS